MLAQFKRNSQRKGSASTGAALAELALAIPFLLIVLAGVVNLGVVLHLYLSLSRVSYEGARYGAIVPGLEVGDGWKRDNNGDLVLDGPDGGAVVLPGHQQLRDRIALLLDDAKLYDTEVAISTELLEPGDLSDSYGPGGYIDTSGSCVGIFRNIVRVRATLTSIPIPFLGVGFEVPAITVIADAPYLYRNSS